MVLDSLKKSCIPISIAILLLMLTTQSFSDEIVIGVRAHRGEAYATERWTPTISYLQHKLPEHNFSLRAIESIHEMEVLVSKNQLDFVITQPVAYVDLERLYNATRLLTLEKKGHLSQFGSVIITQSDREDIKFLKDVKGKSIAGVAEKGFGGWLIGYSELTKHGISSHKNFSRVEFTGDQYEVVNTVLNRQIDVGIVRTGILENMISEDILEINKLKVLNQRNVQNFSFLLSTELYPEWAFAKTENISPEIARQVALTLLLLPDNNEANIKGKYARWNTPLNYNSVHELMKTLKIGSYSMHGDVTVEEFISQNHASVILIIFIIMIMLVYLVKIKTLEISLEKSNIKLQQLSEIDPLTQIANRRVYEVRMLKEIQSSYRSGSPVSLLMIDIDNFKEYNDNYGHDNGDLVLSRVAESIQNSLPRHTDLAARFGGEEFVVLLPFTYLEGALKQAEKIRKNIMHLEIEHAYSSVDAHLTISVGVSILKDRNMNQAEFFNHADKALYQAKKAGRNQVVCYEY